MLKTRLPAMDAANKKEAEETSNDMDTSMTVLGKHTRTLQVPMDAGMKRGESTEKRPCNEARELHEQ